LPLAEGGNHVRVLLVPALRLQLTTPHPSSGYLKNWFHEREHLVKLSSDLNEILKRLNNATPDDGADS
jgi:hypothetical protein